MAVKEIIQQGHKTLGNKSKEVLNNEFSSKKLSSIIEDMSDTLANTRAGVAIAAPQIDVSKRIFVVRGSVFGEEIDDQVYINPKIIKKSKDKKSLEEGCLSCGIWYGEVERNLKVIITYQNINGTKRQRGASGLLAQIFQHEIDHLDGVLFKSKASNLQEINSDKNERDSKEDTK